MSDTKLHKNKGKTRRNVIEDTPFDVKMFFDRKCGKNWGKQCKKKILEKEMKEEDREIREML